VLLKSLPAAAAITGVTAEPVAAAADKQEKLLVDQVTII
jgi:hypothetical protein